MSQKRGGEPLLPPWAAGVLLKIGPPAVLIVTYYVLRTVARVPPGILIPALLVPALAMLVYFGGRFYKPFYVGRDGRCTAGGPKQRAACRHYIPGARLGGGCGRLREDGRCRHG